MGFLKFISKVASTIDPVSKKLRDKGGALGTIGAIMNPGGAAGAKIAAGAPINTRTLMDPNGWVAPGPPPPEAPPQPLPPLAGAPGSGAALPPGLMPRAVPYSYPPQDAGLLTQLAYRMAGQPPPNPPGATPYPGMPIGSPGQPPMSGVPGQIDHRVNLPQMGQNVSPYGLPMTDPYSVLWRNFNG